jgi:hypothetical protein
MDLSYAKITNSLAQLKATSASFNDINFSLNFEVFLMRHLISCHSMLKRSFSMLHATIHMSSSELGPHDKPVGRNPRCTARRCSRNSVRSHNQHFSAQTTQFALFSTMDNGLQYVFYVLVPLVILQRLQN